MMVFLMFQIDNTHEKNTQKTACIRAQKKETGHTYTRGKKKRTLICGQ